MWALVRVGGRDFGRVSPKVTLPGSYDTRPRNVYVTKGVKFTTGWSHSFHRDPPWFAEK